MMLPKSRRSVAYAGDPAGLGHLENAGINLVPADTAKLSADQAVVVGPGGGRTLAAGAQAVALWLKEGGNLLLIGLDEQDATVFLPSRVRTKKAEHISGYFDRPDRASLLLGVGPGDLHNRDPRQMPLVIEGATIIGDGALATMEGMNVVFCQLAPWQWEGDSKPNIKRTYRRVSFLASRLLANMGVHGETPLLARFAAPASADAEPRWRAGLYLDRPEESDDPYRFFRW